MRVRKNVYDLPAGDMTLEWYGKAVTAMKALPRTNPRSWEYQAAVHGTVGNVPADAAKFWQQCQHGSSFFLPWHRMYLLHFERIVESHIVALGGPANWALPYWNYSRDDQARALPPAFLGATLANGQPNPLYVAQRRADANKGSRFLQDADVDLRAALFAEPTTDGFFGGEAADHSGGEFGWLEGTVHNIIHGRIGGMMGDPDLAALDPIFWLHHCNIDRLWDVWCARDPGNTNLTSAFWRSGKFDFHDSAGNALTMQTVDVLQGAVDYEYDDISDPFAVPGIAGAQPTPMASSGSKELVGATTAPIELGDQTIAHDVPTPVSPQAFAAAGVPAGLGPPAGPPSKLVKRAILRLEHVTSAAVCPIYDVYVNLPSAPTPAQHKDHFAGRVAMFGIPQASSPSGQHAGSGQDFSLDITKLYHRLADAGGISASSLRVSFEPVDPEPGTKVTVGRISLYFA